MRNLNTVLLQFLTAFKELKYHINDGKNRFPFEIGEKSLQVDFGKRGRKTGPPRAKLSSQVGTDWNSVHIRLQWWEALSMTTMPS